MTKVDDIGRFWLASDPDNKVHGALTFDPDSGGRLRLDGILGGPQLKDEDDNQRILGETNGTGYTLNHCQELNRNLHIGTEPRSGVSTWSVGEIYQNVWFGPEDDLSFDALSADLEDMTSWIDESGITSSGLQRDGGALGENVKAVLLNPCQRETDIGTITITHSIGASNSLPRDYTVQQTRGFRINTDGLTSKEDLLEIASDIQDIVSIGINRLSAFIKVQFGHPEGVRAIGDETSRVAIDFYTRWRVTAGAHAEPPKSIAFTYKDIGGLDGLADWLALAAQHRKVLGRIMATRQPGGMFSEDRLLNCVAAAEGLYRALVDPPRKEEPSLHTMLIHLTQLAGPQFEEAVIDPVLWSEFLKEERNEISHNFNRRPSSNVDHYWHMADSVYWMIILCLLSQMPTAQPAIDRTIYSQPFRWMMIDLAKTMRSL
ncbi:MAG: hypothetical protein QOG10_1307 [Kribbellaceae bacterium]|jgi:hypothetical protein|nr:hypothetical protein [Kribbellaceae bacterium]